MKLKSKQLCPSYIYIFITTDITLTYAYTSVHVVIELCREIEIIPKACPPQAPPVPNEFEILGEKTAGLL